MESSDSKSSIGEEQCSQLTRKKRTSHSELTDEWETVGKIEKVDIVQKREQGEAKERSGKKEGEDKRDEDILSSGAASCDQSNSRTSHPYDRHTETERRGAEFVDNHRAALIQRVTMVMPIADTLFQERMVHPELYSTIRTTQTSQGQMRELYEAFTSGGLKVKSAFYQILQENQPNLVQDLDGTFQTPQGSTTKPVMFRFKKKQQNRLKKKFTYTFEGTTEDEQTLFNSIYTQLNITEGETKGVNTEHEIRQIEYPSMGKPSSNKPIKCTELFAPRPEQEREIRTVLMKGIAGIGKTVSVQMFVLDWAEGLSNQDIDLIFVLPFRELNLIKDDHSLHSLLNEFQPELEIEDPQIYENHKVLLIFDGLDESRFPLDFKNNESVTDVMKKSSVDVLLTNLMKKKLLPSSLFWITSRPAAASKIPRRIVNLNLVIEVLGFTDEQKEEYFKKRCGDDENLANIIISHIKAARSLHIMCYIPVMCWITTKVLEHILRENDGGEIPTTLTEMYIHFLIIQIELAKEKYQELSKGLILKLGQLAFQQLEKGYPIFYEQDLRRCGIDVHEAAVICGLCTEFVRVEHGLYKKNVYCFVHLSFQEFLAALYVFYCSVTKKICALESLQNVSTELPLHEILKRVVDKALQSENGHLDLFLRFLLGITLESNQNLLQGILPQTENNSETVDEMKKYLRKPDVENISPDRYINLLLCLTEMKDSSVQGDIQKFLTSMVQDEDALSEDHCSAVANALLMSQGVLDEMNLGTYNIDWLKRNKLIPALRKCRKAVLMNTVLCYKSCESLVSTLKSPDSPLRELHLRNVALHEDDDRLRVVFDVLRSPHCKLETLRLTNMKLSFKDFESLASVLKSPDSPLRELHLKNIRLPDDDDDDDDYYYYDNDDHDDDNENDVKDNNDGDDDNDDGDDDNHDGDDDNHDGDDDNDDGDDDELSVLFAGLSSPHCKLETLKLERFFPTEKSLGRLVSALRLKSHLRELDLSHSELQDSGVRLLSDGLKSPHCRLEILRLPFCQVTEEGCSSLASALRSNPSHLRELDLSFNHSGDPGVKLLSDPLFRLENLKVVHNEEIWVKPQLLKKYACALTLDPNTAHRNHSLSEDKRRVVWEEVEQPYPDHPERFDNETQVLCREGLTGRHYWEVEWEANGPLTGVTYKSISRKGEGPACSLGDNDKSWCMYCSDESASVWHNNEGIILPTSFSLSSRVGVYLDWPAGILSFYSISPDTVNRLYTFDTTFTEPLYPVLMVKESSMSLCQVE